MRLAHQVMRFVLASVVVLFVVLVGASAGDVIVDASAGQHVPPPLLPNLLHNQTAIVERLQEYLRTKTVQPHPEEGYRAATEFLRRQAEQIGLDFLVKEYVENKPVIVLRWNGSDPNQKSVMLNSHLDVVPVDESRWTHPPFAAERTEDGNIYARGAQDMKSVGMGYLEAIELLKRGGFIPLRTVFITFVPDEEIGGHSGMIQLIRSDEFRNMNVGFVLDEGLASADDRFLLFYGERAVWWIRVVAEGPPGHGAMLVEDTSTEKIARVVSRLLDFRRTQQEAMKKDGKRQGEVTTINLTFLRAGHTQDCGNSFSPNVIPSTAEAGFDIRVPPTWTTDDFLRQLNAWVLQESNVTLQFLQKTPINRATDISDANPFWVSFRDACDDVGIELIPTIFPAATDSRHIRNSAGLPCLGFSPMNRTPVLLHDHDEFINEKVYLRGIEIYSKIISHLADTVTQS